MDFHNSSGYGREIVIFWRPTIKTIEFDDAVGMIDEWEFGKYFSVFLLCHCLKCDP